MTASSDPIVITGAAVATSLGLNRADVWRAVVAGRCGMRPFTALETPLPDDKLGGQALDLPPDYRPREPREVRYLSWTIADALRDAAVADALPYPPHRCGVMLGTTLHGMRAAGEFLRSQNCEPLRAFLASHTLARACAPFDLDGLAATTCSACSSSLGAIALAVTLLQSGELDLVVAGGYDTVSEYVYGGFNALRLVADGPLRPFANQRQGMKIAEGYGLVVLERASTARARSAGTIATILGCGETADAHHLTQPHPHGDGAARAIEAALKSARLTPADIDLISAHATGTPDNDAGEFAAFSRVFGERLPRVPVVAFKSHLGHTLGGAGAVELILSAMAIGEQTIPPCANSRADDLEFPRLNLSTGASRPAAIRATVNTSLGFGGANTAVVLGPGVASPVARAPRPCSSGALDGPSERAGEPPVPQAHRNHDVLITGIGVVLPGAVGADAFTFRLTTNHEPAWLADSGAVAEADYLHLLNARRVRRMSDYVKLALAATALALQDSKLDQLDGYGDACSVVLGSAHGSADFSATYYQAIVDQGFAGANPVLFAEGVPNAAAAHLSLMLGLKGACQTVIGSRTSGLDALHLASLRIRCGEWDRAIVGAGEEYNPLVNRAYEHCGLHAGAAGAPPAQRKGFTTGAAAVTFVLESRRSAEARGARAHGSVIASAASRGRPGESIESAVRVLETLGRPGHVLAGLSGTWTDRAEAAALRRAAPSAVVSSLYGHTAEHFSAMPLLAVAAVLLTGKLPRLLQPIDRVAAASGTERPDRAAAICTDFTGCVSGVLFGRESPIRDGR
ncbi:MAG TPA: beta-ketoacyl-[acyl-carrier-protein] synthase family protein [Tepidisphaeraceae bacterium]|nr:beta-ketoacyl-[acyl-carrier-protein] synthase family protein [Tepidisphaeraceae bacterium]